jgi:hypothetical protein
MFDYYFLSVEDKIMENKGKHRVFVFRYCTTYMLFCYAEKFLVAVWYVSSPPCVTTGK